MSGILGDHPHTDPGDGRSECERCGKWIWPATHSCKGVPVTVAAARRLGMSESDEMELEVLQTALTAFQRLDAETGDRALRWLVDRLRSDWTKVETDAAEVSR